MKNNHFLRSIFAISIILAGTVLVLANIGIISWDFMEAWLYIYPAFFVLLGLKWTFDGIRGRAGLSAGSFLAIFGSLLLLDRFQIIAFTFGDVYKLWPLLLVYLGFSIFGSSTRRKRKRTFQFIFDSDKHQSKKMPRKQKFAIGDHDFSNANWQVEPMDLWNAVGDYHLDFTKAFIPDEEIPISIQGWAGDIRILMPENVELAIEAHVKAGDINVFGLNAEGINREVFYETPNYKQATRKLDIYLSLKAGSIRVDRV
ncbi:cell wall-active antibiotics response protein LiaF [Sediminibacillus albus]|uniref:Lia operon protein LiaF n=1 Tax=Sediminibacillus albus TaxID=407036 RepID=A0A1G8XDP3_9BACI|nr:cell wall-active antibiotics response protein LiaF [Sediminibacillus albus]SDJ88526.1 lia operon protein LiaF [Sediminibacillus albus]